MPEDDELKSRMRSLSDDELRRVVHVDSEQYRSEALECARAEIAARGLEHLPKRATNESDQIWAITCPNCGVANPPKTIRCPCGYEFQHPGTGRRPPVEPYVIQTWLTRQLVRVKESYLRKGDDPSKDLNSAERAIRQGSNAAFVSAAFTLLFVLIALGSESEGIIEELGATSTLFDVILITGLAVGVRRRSRMSALLMLVYFIVGKISMFIASGQVTGLGVSLVFVYYFARAVQGTFAYHQIRRAQDPDYRAAQKWTYVAWPVAGFLILALLGLGLLTEMGVLPDTAVVSGGDLSETNLELLRSTGVLMEDEEILLFYSAGLLSILEDGNLLTDRRVISYETVGEELQIYFAEYSQIEDVSVASDGGAMEDAVILVTTVLGEQFFVLASTEDEGNERFLSELESRWKAAIVEVEAP